MSAPVNSSDAVTFLRPGDCAASSPRAGCGTDMRRARGFTMHVGMTAIFQHPDGNDGDPIRDAEVYATEYRMADRAEALGFDSLWGVEHHINGYAMCPDPLKFLTYFAARTKHIR